MRTMEYLSQKVLPRLDALEAQQRKLETRFNSKPTLYIEIESTDADKLVESMLKIFNNFNAVATININANLKEAASSGV